MDTIQERIQAIAEFEKFAAKIAAMHEIQRIEWWLKYQEDRANNRHKKTRMELLLWLWLLLMEEDSPSSFFSRCWSTTGPGSGINNDVLVPLMLASSSLKFGQEATSKTVAEGKPGIDAVSTKEYVRWFFDPDRPNQQLAYDHQFRRWDYSPQPKIRELYDPSAGVDWERTKNDEDYYQSVKRQTGPGSNRP
jgi:hypothetical protein